MREKERIGTIPGLDPERTNMSILLAASLIPPFFLLWKVYQSDKIEREPLGLLFTIFLFGMLSTLPAGILEGIGQALLENFLPEGTDTRVVNLLFYFIVVGGAEELVKFFAMKLPTWRSREFNYVFDGVVYGVTASLGFAALENVLYVLDSGLTTAGVRAWTAIPLHCITGIFMGHYYGIAKAAEVWHESRIRGRMLRRSILIPVLIHGAYDFIATDGGEVLMGVFFVYIVVLDYIALRSLRKYAGTDVRIF